MVVEPERKRTVRLRTSRKEALDMVFVLVGGLEVTVRGDRMRVGVRRQKGLG